MNTNEIGLDRGPKAPKVREPESNESPEREPSQIETPLNDPSPKAPPLEAPTDSDPNVEDEREREVQLLSRMS